MGPFEAAHRRRETHKERHFPQFVKYILQF